MSSATAFRFADPVVRKHVYALADLLYYANSRNDGRWASQPNGVYGACHETIKLILVEVCGEKIGLEADDSINYGGNRSWGEDIEVAVQEALENQQAELAEASAIEQDG